jgi:hypothetical protein
MMMANPLFFLFFPFLFFFFSFLFFPLFSFLIENGKLEKKRKLFTFNLNEIYRYYAAKSFFAAVNLKKSLKSHGVFFFKALVELDGEVLSFGWETV